MLTPSEFQGHPAGLGRDVHEVEGRCGFLGRPSLFRDVGWGLLELADDLAWLPLDKIRTARHSL